ncbi:unnamed protein product [Moneuplotes crassus]|uniref:Uncharacterized protein n=1 Tax=Euplotes crassus TaxID=5936 RepID=A0AAD1U6S3_EUPCR|nr:unnamed protein product [Moneuplotes crassus]
MSSKRTEFLKKFKNKITLIKKDGLPGVIQNSNQPIQKSINFSSSRISSLIQKKLGNKNGYNDMKHRLSQENPSRNIKIQKFENSVETKDTSTNLTIKSKMMMSKNSGYSIKHQKSERKMFPQKIAMNSKPPPLLKDDLNISVYENNQSNDIKFYDGNVQRETPSFNDVRAYLKKIPKEQRNNDRNKSIKIHNSSSTGITPIKAKDRSILPYAEQGEKRRRPEHERQSSLLTLPKLDESEDFANYKKIRSRMLMSEQKKSRKDNLYLRFRSSEETSLKSGSKSRKSKLIKKNIKSGGRNLRKSNIDIKNKSTLSVEQFNLNIKNVSKTKRGKSNNTETSKNHIYEKKFGYSRRNVSPYVPSDLRNSNEKSMKPQIEICSLDEPMRLKGRNRETSDNLTESLPSIKDPKRSLILPYSLRSVSKRYIKFGQNPTRCDGIIHKGSENLLCGSAKKQIQSTENVNRTKSHSKPHPKNFLIIKDDFEDIDRLLLGDKRSKDQINYYEKMTESYKMNSSTNLM